MSSLSVQTQFGALTPIADGEAIIGLRWDGVETGAPSAVLSEACRQLRAYAEGRLEQFDLPLRLTGSVFQQSVCAVMRDIPFGETLTYGDIAKQLGASAQAVGGACGGNPIPILIPCHRVMGAKGLTGFSGAGGVETKVALLRHEKAAGLLI